MSLFSSCFGCCGKKKEIKKATTTQFQSNSNSRIGNENRAPNVPENLVNSVPAIKPRSQIKSNINREEIVVKDFMPEIEERKIYRYNCPLCFLYLSNMLSCATCKNYVCLFCAENIISREDLESPSPIQAHCPFCDASPFILIDVKSEDPVKRYTDTPYSSMASNFKFSGRGLLQMKLSKMRGTLPLKEDSFSKPVEEDKKQHTAIGFPGNVTKEEEFYNSAPGFAKNINCYDPQPVILGSNYYLSNGVKYRRSHQHRERPRSERNFRFEEEYNNISQSKLIQHYSDNDVHPEESARKYRSFPKNWIGNPGESKVWKDFNESGDQFERAEEIIHDMGRPSSQHLQSSYNRVSL